MPTIQQTIAPLFLRRLLRSHTGRAFVLHQAAVAEGSDEGRIFDELLAAVDDEEIRKLVRIHQADETRHAELFAAAASRASARIPQLPAHLLLLERLSTALGGFFEQFHSGTRGVMDMYLLLQVIEERATTQFRIMEPELRRFDPEAADMMLTIAADEDRHLKYCRAIARKYAPSDVVREQTLAEIRRVEAQVFGEHSRDSMEHCLDEGLADIPSYEMPVWRALLRFGKKSNLPVPSAFWSAPSPLQARWQHLVAKSA